MLRAASPSASETQITARAWLRIQRTSPGCFRQSLKSSRKPPEIVPWSVTTNGLPQKSAITPPASQWAWTRSASRAARRSARIIDQARRGAIQGRCLTLCMIPPPSKTSPYSL